MGEVITLDRRPFASKPGGRQQDDHVWLSFYGRNWRISRMHRHPDGHLCVDCVNYDERRSLCLTLSMRDFNAESYAAAALAMMSRRDAEDLVPIT